MGSEACWSVAVVLVLLALAGCVCGGALSRTEARVGEVVLDLEIAVSASERACGLAYRKSLPTDSGMLFVFSERSEVFFWSRDLRIPLDLAFLNEHGEILVIHQMQPGSRRYHKSPQVTRYAIETHIHWFRNRGIGVGDVVEWSDYSGYFSANQ